MRLGAAIGNRALARQVLARDPQPTVGELVSKSDWKRAAAQLNRLKYDDAVAQVNRLTADQLAKVHQAGAETKAGAKSWAALLTTPLITAFQAKFATGAAMLRESPEAVRLAAEADADGVKFGGFSEDGPGKVTVGAWPYTDPDTKSVYIPKSRQDPGIAMAGFVFELNNALRTPQVQAVHKAAKEGKLTAKEFARRLIALEVEGVLRTGGIWAAYKGRQKPSKLLDAYDDEFFLKHYRAVAGGRKTKAQLIAETAAGRFRTGTTTEQYYIAQFDKLYGQQKAAK